MIDCQSKTVCTVMRSSVLLLLVALSILPWSEARVSLSGGHQENSGESSGEVVMARFYGLKHCTRTQCCVYYLSCCTLKGAYHCCNGPLVKMVAPPC
ncbi:unnamed protein product [Nezara viridula]|uniref:Neuropeptide n=1 Tax=Nezara viridula TaxID=85310 RepID=A0A9P0MML8_NEZVI|nr:unnamed protein product [Nezara viridula]